MDKKDLKLIRLAAVAITAAALYAGSRIIPVIDKPSGNGSQITIVRAIDGDTLKLSNGERVRLIGIDTPEAHHSEKLVRDARRSGKDIKAIQSLGLQASKFTKKLCEGRAARIEEDVKKRDRYGRLLGYVYLDDGTFVNARIIEEGYAQVLTIPPNVKYADMFLKIQRKAREEKKGLWSNPGNFPQT